MSGRHIDFRVFSCLLLFSRLRSNSLCVEDRLISYTEKVLHGNADQIARFELCSIPVVVTESNKVFQNVEQDFVWF